LVLVPLDLPKVFLAAQALFGRTSLHFDPDKGSFSFPLVLSATRDGLALRYFILLRDCRGSIEAPFHRLQNERRAPLLTQSQAPVEHELSRAEINDLTDCLIGFLRAHGDGLAVIAPPFHRAVRSEFLVYGCRSGEPFERTFANELGYHRVLRLIESELTESESKGEFAYVRELLEDISRGELRHW
jgi:hypothetical protein